MKKLLIAAVVSTLAIPGVACTSKTNVVETPPTEPAPTEPTDGTEADAGEADAGPAPTSSSKKPEDRCLDGQDMDADDVDISACPALPEIPEQTLMGKEKIDTGAWEIGTTAEGETYKYGTLSAAGTEPRVLSYDGGETEVDAKNIECWAKGYYRLRKMLQTPPAEYVALRKAKFQYRFFQFQTDLRNGPTGYKKISSFQDHLVKWVTIVDAKGKCEQPTMKKFKEYAKAELDTRGLPQPTEE